MKPWGPGLETEAVAVVESTAAAVPMRMAADGRRMAMEAIFISKASIFLPRYSGVRPTMRPPMNTATRANSSMP